MLSDSKSNNSDAFLKKNHQNFDIKFDIKTFRGLICFFCPLLYFPLQNMSLKCKRHHCRWRAAQFRRCSSYMTFDQEARFIVPHLLWQITMVLSGHMRRKAQKWSPYFYKQWAANNDFLLRSHLFRDFRGFLLFIIWIFFWKLKSTGNVINFF